MCKFFFHAQGTRKESLAYGLNVNPLITHERMIDGLTVKALTVKALTIKTLTIKVLSIKTFTIHALTIYRLINGFNVYFNPWFVAVPFGDY